MLVDLKSPSHYSVWWVYENQVSLFDIARGVSSAAYIFLTHSHTRRIALMPVGARECSMRASIVRVSSGGGGDTHTFTYMYICCRWLRKCNCKACASCTFCIFTCINTIYIYLYKYYSYIPNTYEQRLHFQRPQPNIKHILFRNSRESVHPFIFRVYMMSFVCVRCIHSWL